MKAKFLHFKNYIIFQIKMPYDTGYFAHVIEKSKMSFKFFFKKLFYSIIYSEPLNPVNKDDIV